MTRLGQERNRSRCRWIPGTILQGDSRARMRRHPLRIARGLRACDAGNGRPFFLIVTRTSRSRASHGGFELHRCVAEIQVPCCRLVVRLPSRRFHAYDFPLSGIRDGPKGRAAMLLMATTALRTCSLHLHEIVLHFTEIATRKMRAIGDIVSSCSTPIGGFTRSGAECSYATARRTV